MLPRTRLIAWATLAGVIVVVFWPAIHNAPIWDDEYLTTRNPFFTSASGVWHLLTTDMWTSSAKQEPSGYYRPLVSLSYAVNRWIGGNSAASYHVGNILAHAGVAVAVFELLVTVRAARPVGAWIAAALFALAPLTVESVSWLAGRYDPLGTLFAVLAVRAHARRARWQPLVYFAAALLCKEPFVVVVALFVVYDLTLGAVDLHAVRTYVGAILFLVGYAILRRVAHVPSPEGVLAQTGVTLLSKTFVFTASSLAPQLVAPTNLSPFRVYHAPTVAAWTAVVTTIVGVTAFLFWLRSRGSTRAIANRMLFGWAWALIALAPASATAPTLGVIGDRYAYLPSVGLYLLFATATTALKPRLNRVVLGACVPVILTQALATRARLTEWRDVDTLCDVTLRGDPDNFLALTLLGGNLAERGQFAEAEVALEHGRLHAIYTWRIDVALCYVHINQGAFDRARADCTNALRDNPNDPRAWGNYAAVLVDTHSYARARDAATQALALKPRYAEAHYVRAIALANLGRFDDARRDAEDALAIEPDHTGAKKLRTQLDAVHP